MSKYEGVWHCIHSTAAVSNTGKLVDYFCYWVRMQIPRLGCDSCTKHANEYMEINPPENCSDPFVWSWEFHNAVNKRLGKKELPIGEAMSKWISGSEYICKGDC